MLTLDSPIYQLNRVGKATAFKLKRLGIENVSDLFYYYPFRYEDFSHVLPINQLVPGESATIKGKIELIKNRRSFRKRMIITEAFINDSTGQVKAIWFRQPFITKLLKIGDEVYLSGKVEGDLLENYFSNPLYEKAKTEQTHTARIIPLYSLTEGLTQKQLRFLIKSITPLVQYLKEWLPIQVIREENLINIKEAIQQIHFPANFHSLAQAQKRLKFDELFLIQLQSQLIKNELAKSQASSIKFYQEKIKKFVDSLPFQLTNAQRKATWEIIQDLGKNKPMNRLLEGDVGSGKTMVAIISALNVIFNNKQVAFMAPTEILARQHFLNISKILKKYPINIGLLTNSFNEINNQSLIMNHESLKTKHKSKTTQRKLILQAIAQGKINFIIGTHALIQEKANFKSLEFVIIDEQHRFGVEQRKALREKSGNPLTSPHLLSMTATPIPRSLALTLYGDLDLSVLDEMPKDRKKIITKLVSPKDRSKAYEFIKNQINLGHQVFVICPLIEESDKLGVKAATAEYQKLKEEIFPEYQIGLVHGKLKAKEKEKVMNEFSQNKLHILVATAVVEVGIDIPNATVMIIEGAERFGLAQLHQFRGRIGRGTDQSYCFLFTDSWSEKTQKRLQALITCQNGFELAETDLKLRGAGDLYGTIQSGFLDNLKIASLSDFDLIKKAKYQAEKLIQKNPHFDNLPTLQEKLNQFFARIHLE